MNTLKILLAYGDDEHIDYQALLLSKNLDHEDPLIIAIKHEYVDILDLLFNKLPNIYQDEDMKKTLMQYLLHDQCIKSLRYLLDKKLFDINAVMFLDKATLLMRAVRFNYVSVVKFLLDYGADISIKDDKNKTALNYAEENNNQMMINLLTKASSKK